MQHIHNISIKSEFSVASDDEGLLPKGEMNLRLGSQLTCSSLTDSLHGIYQDIPQNNLLLPSLQSLPTLSQSFTSTSAPIIKKEKQDHDQSSLPDIQYPLSSAPDHLNSSLLSSSHDCGSILNDESWLKGQNNAEQSGRLSPTSVSERSIPMYKNDNSFCSLEEITESSNEISDHDIDFDSVYEVLDTENIENILEKNYIPFSLPSMPSPVDITDSLSLLSAPTDSTLIKRSRSVVEEDNLGYTSCMNIKRSRRLNSLVPVPRKSRPAEYQCSKCSENYEITVEENSWWAIYVQECPHCNELQIPRIDINSSINAIESDPNMIALYGDGSGDSDDDEGEGGFDYGSDEDETDVLLPLNQINFFPFGGEGELTIEEATQLIPLMSHARVCNGQHISEDGVEVCNSIKYIMLHVRDCPHESRRIDTDQQLSSSSDNISHNTCNFTWCHGVKKLLFHLTHCTDSLNCIVCTPTCLPCNLQYLNKINNNTCIIKTENT